MKINEVITIYHKSNTPIIVKQTNNQPQGIKPQNTMKHHTHRRASIMPHRRATIMPTGEQPKSIWNFFLYK